MAKLTPYPNLLELEFPSVTLRFTLAGGGRAQSANPPTLRLPVAKVTAPVVSNRWWFAVLAMCIIGAILFSAMARSPTKPKRLYAEPRFVDLGECEQGTTRPLEFTIHNGTNKPVTLVAIPKSCCNSEGVFSKNELLPGEKTRVATDWRLANQRGKRMLAAQLRACALTRPRTAGLFANASLFKDDPTATVALSIP
jgi:uncharacterized protein (DUF58 family)